MQQQAKNIRPGHLDINFNYFKHSSANLPPYSFLSLSSIVWQSVLDSILNVNKKQNSGDWF